MPPFALERRSKDIVWQMGCTCREAEKFLTASSFVQEVEQAPTVDQCRADRAYWMSLAEKPDMHGADEVSYETLTGWVKEMDKCEAVDPANYFKYYNAFAEVEATQQFRSVNFLHRHNLWDQFIAEDAAGKR